MLTFASWNINLTGGSNAARRKLTAVQHLAWDVLALQEVTPVAASVFAAADFDSWLCPPATQKHSVALASRNGVVLSTPALMTDLEVPERGLWASATVGGLNVEVGSLHVTNAADGKAKIKQQHYVALTQWLGTDGPPRVLGMDSNHAYDPKWPDLPGEVYPPRPDEWAEEFAFFSADATHGLKDAWLERLQARPDELARARAMASDEASACSYEGRGRGGKRRRSRMDCVFVSNDVGVLGAEYVHSVRGPGLSDHSLVAATLQLPPRLKP